MMFTNGNISQLVNASDQDVKTPLPAAPGKALPDNIFINSYDSENTEMIGVVNHVHELLQPQTDPAKIIIIYQREDDLERLQQYLQLKNIPFFSKQKINILEAPFVRKIIHLLHYISAEQQAAFSGNHLLFELLHIDFYKIASVEIARLVVEANNKKINRIPVPLRQLLQEKICAPAKDLFDPGMDKELKDVSLILEKLITQSPGSHLPELFEDIIRENSILSYIEQSEHSPWLKRLLETLRDFINDWSADNRSLSLTDLVKEIDRMGKERLPLTVSRLNDGSNGVRLMTINEMTAPDFEYLFITGAHLLSHENLKSIAFQSFRRFFEEILHASTPEKKPVIFISFSKNNDAEGELNPTSFIQEIQSQYSFSVNNITLKSDESTNFFPQVKTLLPEIAPIEDELISPLLKKFVMNVSALNNYLHCPLEFYYKNILRIPSAKNEAMEFGNAVHYALEQLFRKMSAAQLSASVNHQQQRFPPPEEMMADFNSYMQSRRDHFTPEAFERKMRHGDEVLNNYYARSVDAWSTVVSIERNIRGTTPDGVPIKGKIDKLEFNGKEVTIVDYKSGSVEKALLKLTPPHDDNPNGGDYWRQAVFYKILVDNYEQKDWKVTGAEFDFIEPDRNKNYHREKIMIGSADIETVSRQISRAWAGIQAKDFYTGCGGQDCHWCNFVKENKLAVALHAK